MTYANPESLQATVLGYLMADKNAHDGHQAVFSYEIEKRLPLIKSPTLLISGGSNDVFYSQLEATKNLIPRCKTTVIEGAGNLIPMERTDEFVQIATDFLSDPGV
jgi:pimeloyl-ACP methyl ester carboxylesterase